MHASNVNKHFFFVQLGAAVLNTVCASALKGNVGCVGVGEHSDYSRRLKQSELGST